MSEWTRRLQSGLARSSRVHPGAADGVFGPRTARSLFAFMGARDGHWLDVWSSDAPGHFRRFGLLEAPERLVHFMGECAHESAGFTRLEENLFYTTPAALRRAWPGRFGRLSDSDLQPLLRNPEALAMRVYDGRRDLGNHEPGDGWRYRGRGLKQLTGRANYARFQAGTGVRVLDEPDLLLQPDKALFSALSYWQWRQINGIADRPRSPQTDRAVTVAVNGGVNGLSDRTARKNRLRRLMEAG